MIIKHYKIFLDSSIFIAAAGSSSGGSSMILELCRKNLFKAFITRKILTEAHRNIRAKLKEEALLRFYKDISSIEFEILEPIKDSDLKKFDDIIDPKDRHVLAAAIKAGTDFLITLDRKHFQTETIKKINYPIKIATTKEFLSWVLNSGIKKHE